MRKVDERAADETATLKIAMDCVSNNLRVALPGIISEWNEEQQTVNVQPVLRENVNVRGQVGEMNIPLLVDVPVVFPSAGGYSFLCAPQPGDECLIVFADMCIDAWWQSGEVQSQVEKRRHDLSDGFAIMGCWSQPNIKERFPSPEDGCVLGKDEEGPRVIIKEDEMRLEQSEEGPAITLKDGMVSIEGELIINGEPYMEHRHSGVEPGGGRSGVVVG